MAYAIDYTINKFRFFFQFPRTEINVLHLNFVKKTEYVIRKLRKKKDNIFKDNEKKLIVNLIDFYKKINENSKTGDMHFRIKYFNNIWEKMVEKYLNDYFVKVGEENIEFSDIVQNRNVRFKKASIAIDESDRNFKLEPDHYLVDDNKQYIFDSKYYSEIKYLNYKQVSYHKLLSKRVSDEKNTYSALILPGFDESRVHFKLKKEFCESDSVSEEMVILEEYLEVKKVMKNYLENR